MSNSDKPSPPEKPIEVKDVTKNHCTLSWKPPADDGGTEILHYIVEKMDVSRGSWIEAGTSPITSIKA